MFFPQAREDLTIDPAPEGGVIAFVPDSGRSLFGFCSVLPLVLHRLPWADYAVPPSNPIGWLLVVGLTSFAIGPLFLDLFFCRSKLQKN